MGREKFGMGRERINPYWEGKESGLKIIGTGRDRDRNRREAGLGLFAEISRFFFMNVSRIFPVYFPEFFPDFVPEISDCFPLISI